MYSKSQDEIMQHWEDSICPLVSICCTTYNHGQFIEQAIKGFLSQETIFPFEVLIRDDCSTDKTPTIIKAYQKKYPDIIFPIYEEENTYSKGIKPMPVLYKKSKGKYIALCEGDDYWIDSFKLAKQVSFLEKNPDYSLCGTQYNLASSPKDIFSEIGSYSLNDLLLGNRYGTLTVLFHRKYLTKNFYLFINTMPVGDWPLWLFLSIHGKGKIINHITATYRTHSGGVYSSKNKVLQKTLVLEIINKLNNSIFKDSFDHNIIRKSWRTNLYRLFKTKPTKKEIYNFINIIKYSSFLSKKEKKYIFIIIRINFLYLLIIYGFFLKHN
ncbi:MAG: glycosyltransferase [Methylococcaceae bacterium]|nr:glycosyltransferase [Methylococcaceae bacterium]